MVESVWSVSLTYGLTAKRFADGLDKAKAANGTRPKKAIVK